MEIMLWMLVTNTFFVHCLELAEKACNRKTSVMILDGNGALKLY